MAMEVGPMADMDTAVTDMAVTDMADMAAAITELDPTTTVTTDILESTTTATANTMGTRAMATTSMTMTVATMIIMRTIMATMTIMRKTMVTKIAMVMVTKGTMTTITVMKILMVLGASTGATGVTVTITVPSTDLVEATSHSWAIIISSILKASKDLSLTPYRIQSVPTKDPLLTLYRIQARQSKTRVYVNLQWLRRCHPRTRVHCPAPTPYARTRVYGDSPYASWTAVVNLRFSLSSDLPSRSASPCATSTTAHRARTDSDVRPRGCACPGGRSVNQTAGPIFP